MLLVVEVQVQHANPLMPPMKEIGHTHWKCENTMINTHKLYVLAIVHSLLTFTPCLLLLGLLLLDKIGQASLPAADIDREHFE